MTQLAVLRAKKISKHFGGLVAVSNVSIDCPPREIHAVIGPNGAGKSTLINLLSGDLRTTAGEIYIGEERIDRMSVSQKSKLGIGRTYQRTNIFPNLSLFENCFLAAQAYHGTSLRFFKGARAYVDVRDTARMAIEKVDLQSISNRLVGTLSHGEQRQVEIAIALATKPKILLLDEPLAGMGAEESENIINLLSELKSEYAMLLVEHDINAIFALADRLTVMVDGEVIDCGLPNDVRENPRVQEAYLGES